jgi:hypothetical protein
MDVFLFGFGIICLLIFLIGIFTHIRMVRNERWEQKSDTLRSFKKDAMRRAFVSLSGMVVIPIIFILSELIVGKIIPLFILLVVFGEVCVSLVTVSQSHRAILIHNELKKRKTHLESD